MLSALRSSQAEIYLIEIYVIYSYPFGQPQQKGRRAKKKGKLIYMLPLRHVKWFFFCSFVSWIRRLIESVCLTSERRCATLNNNNKIIPMHDSSRMEPMSIPFDKRKTFHPLSLLFPASSEQPAAAAHLKEHRIRSAHNMKTQSDGSTTLYDIFIGPVPRASISKFMCRRKKYHTKNRNLERMNRTQQKHTHITNMFSWSLVGLCINSIKLMLIVGFQLDFHRNFSSQLAERRIWFRFSSGPETFSGCFDEIETIRKRITSHWRQSKCFKFDSKKSKMFLRLKSKYNSLESTWFGISIRPSENNAETR